MFTISTPLKDNNSIYQDAEFSFFNESVYLTPCCYTTPIKDSERTSYEDTVRLIQDNTDKKKFNSSYKLIEDKENDSGISIYGTPVYSIPVRNSSTDLKSRNNSSRNTSDQVEIKKSETIMDQSISIMQNDMSLQDNHADISQIESSLVEQEFISSKSNIILNKNSSFEWETPKTTFVECKTSTSLKSKKHTGTTRKLNHGIIESCPSENMEMNNYCSVNEHNTSSTSLRSMKSRSFAKPSYKLVKRNDRSFLQKILRLKSTRTSPNWTKFNVFKKLFGKPQETNFNLRNRCTTITPNTNGNNNNYGANRHCHHKQLMENRILSSINQLATRLEHIENDIKEIKEFIRSKHHETDKEICTDKKSETMVPRRIPLPPSVPPPPPPPIPSSHLLSLTVPQRFYASSNNLVTPKSPGNRKVKTTCRSSPMNRKFKNELTFKITADDLKSVKLRNTNTPMNRKKPLNYDSRLPMVSVDMLRSVKLKPSRMRRIGDKRRQSLSPYSQREYTGNRSGKILFGSYKQSPDRLLFKLNDESTASPDNRNKNGSISQSNLAKRNLFSVDESEC